MSIKIKILIPSIVLAVVTAITILLSNIFQFSDYVNKTMEDEIGAAARVMANELEGLQSQANTASLYIAEDAMIMASIQNGDRAALLNQARGMQNSIGVDFCTITDAAGVVLARTHEPESYGDNQSAADCISHALSGKNVAAIVKGSPIVLSVQAGAPIYDSQGGVLGAVSTGFQLDTNTFVDLIKTLLNCEASIILGDERISTTVLKEDGTRAAGTKVVSDIAQTVLSGNTYSGQAKILNRSAYTQYSPFYDYNGKVLGMLFVGRYMNEMTNTVWSFVRIGLIITLILLAVLIPAILFIAGRIIKPINAIVEAAHVLAEGDTRISVQSNTKDEMRELAAAFNEIIENNRKQVQIIEAIAQGDLTVSVNERSDKDVMNQALKQMLRQNNDVFSQIIGSAIHVSSGTRQMSDSSQVLAQGATEQAAAVEELSSAIGEVNGITKDSAAMAEKAASLAEKIKENAVKGTEQMERMVRAVKEINTASRSIRKIIKVIDDIAFQTNILSLNAAVEAARAGQYGRGFAVVAEEVRNLASKSAEAAKNTGSLIEDSMTKAELGARIADETAASLDEIVAGINESARIAAEIASSSEHQSSTITQIKEGINQVAEVVQQNSTTAEENAVGSKEMSMQAELLQDLVSRFKLKSDAGKDEEHLPLPSRFQNSSESGMSTISQAEFGFGKY